MPALKFCVLGSAFISKDKECFKVHSIFFTLEFQMFLRWSRESEMHHIVDQCTDEKLCLLYLWVVLKMTFYIWNHLRVGERERKKAQKSGVCKMKVFAFFPTSYQTNVCSLLLGLEMWLMKGTLWTSFLFTIWYEYKLHHQFFCLTLALHSLLFFSFLDLWQVGIGAKDLILYNQDAGEWWTISLFYFNLF